ncbi:MAG: hypothetical protein ACOYYS_27970 [Chloroflexota bacterium]
MMSQFGEPVGMLVAFLLTVAVFSYLIGDNALFRLASHLFIGLAAGFVAILIVYEIVFGIVWPQIVAPMLDWNNFTIYPARIAVIVAVIFGFLLLIGRNRALGRPAVAYLVGVGAATAIGGALFGTLVPQVEAAAQVVAPNIAVGAIAFVATITSLVYFNFRARVIGEQATKRQFWIEGLGALGQGFVAITFGVLYAMTFTAALTAFVQRFSSIWQFFQRVIEFFPQI